MKGSDSGNHKLLTDLYRHEWTTACPFCDPSKITPMHHYALPQNDALPKGSYLSVDAVAGSVINSPFHVDAGAPRILGSTNTLFFLNGVLRTPAFLNR